MNSVLRKLLERNNLVEKDGEWYYFTIFTKLKTIYYI